MRIVGILICLMLCIAFANARDPSDPRFAYSIPFLPPDKSLKTTDPLYAGKCIFIVNVVQPVAGPHPDPWAAMYQGSVSAPATYGDPWAQIPSTSRRFIAASSYDLSEAQMQRAGIALGAESWL